MRGILTGLLIDLAMFAAVTAFVIGVSMNLYGVFG